MSDARTLLLEIGCEEIPARMIPKAAKALGDAVVRILQEAQLVEQGTCVAWGGSRRLSVRVASVGERQPDRREQVTGPPVSVAYDADGTLTKAGEGFARKQGVDPATLQRVTTDRGEYVGLEREVTGQTLAEILAERLPVAVSAMTFPKTMRWTTGDHRWVRPVHWLVALHGNEVLAMELFGVASGRASTGHRFLSEAPVELASADEYVEALRGAHVVVDPAERRQRVESLLSATATRLGGVIRADPDLLDEVVDLVEWPGVVGGGFEEDFLGLPPEVLVVTLRYHQKCFSMENAEGELLPGFLAIANTDRDPSGHIQRGNEWVVSGRLEDARFFWKEDRKRTLASRLDELGRVVFHAKVGSYLDKAKRTVAIATRLAARLDWPEERTARAGESATLAKIDLVTGTVGEFPELQGKIGGLMLREEGGDVEVADGVYEHYLPEGPDDPIPASDIGCLVSVSDKLDSIAALVGAGETPTGSRDPLALRRAGSGLFRVLIERAWDLSINDLLRACGGGDACGEFLADRLQKFLRDAGFHVNEIQAVWLPWIERSGVGEVRPAGIAARLAPLTAVRARDDFSRLADLVKRVDTILTRNAERFDGMRDQAGGASDGLSSDSERQLATLVEAKQEILVNQETDGNYDGVVDTLAMFVEPVDRFFADVLVIDEKDPGGSVARADLLARLRTILIRCFDLRELAGKAEKETA
ncbi:MAG: glycine--tRNA ligase subunit beta [Acidobacteriota bacterium]|nr:glycine--tRNA ligase subunit beta [Acidobacteriota bacterium]